MRLLYTVLLLILIPLTLHAAFTATYEPEQVLFFEPGATPLDTNKLVAKLGTLKIYHDDKIHHPTLVATDLSHEFLFEGPISSVSGGSDYQTDTTIRFQLWAVSTGRHGTIEAKQLNDSNGNHALQSHPGNLQVNPFIAHLYLVSILNRSWFKEGGTYTLLDGTLGDFRVGAKTSGSGYNPGSDPYVPVDESPGDTPTPILPPGVDPKDPENPVIYGNPDDIVICTFSIIDEQAFELHEVYTEGSAVVATAQINLSNVADTYGVTLTFTNATNTFPFLMKLQGTMANPPTIEYKLLFNNIVLDPGDSVAWEGLTNETFTKDISVTSINPTAVQTRLSGSYSDTVYVTSTPIDSE